MQNVNGKSEQTLPSCDHSASNRLIQAYIDKKNLSAALGGCGSAKIQDKAPEQPKDHYSNCPCADCDAWAYEFIDWERSVDPKVLADYRANA